MLAVIYLIFNEGYAVSSCDRLIGEELTREAIRLGRLLAELMPDEPEAVGLLALMLLEQARSRARSTPEGKLIPLREQDRSRWTRSLIQEGQDLVRRCLRRNQPGPYQIQAAINAVHSDAPTAAQTDWTQILALYDHLLAITPTPDRRPQPRRRGRRDRRPLRRARQTAVPLAASTGAPVRVEEAFTDRDVGDWNGMPAAQVVKRFGSLDHAPGVEPSGDFDRRVLARWASVTAELAGHTLAIVTHDAVIACLLENVVRQTGRPSRPCASRPRAEPARAARRSLVGCRPGRRPR